jgi:hypothetical protein
MPQQTTPPPAAIRISTNTILAGKFYTAGEPLPVASVADLPENLRALVVTGPEPEEYEEPDDGPRNVAFQLNTPYGVDEDGRLTRALRRKIDREVAELEARNSETEWVEAAGLR